MNMRMRPWPMNHQKKKLVEPIFQSIQMGFLGEMLKVKLSQLSF